MNIKKAYNFKEVNELVTCSGTLKNVNLHSLLDEGYDAVINLLPNKNEHAVEGEKKEIESLGMHYEYIPVIWEYPKNSDFESFESAMGIVRGKKNIFTVLQIFEQQLFMLFTHKKIIVGLEQN